VTDKVLTEAQVAATRRTEEAQGMQGGSDPGPRSSERHAENDGGSPPTSLTAGVSGAEAEKTEALRRSIVELIQIHQAALVSAAEKARVRGRPKDDC
jgi:hypothetical protein